MDTTKLQQVCDLAESMTLGAWCRLMAATMAEQPDPDAATAYCQEYNLRQYEAKKLAAYGYTKA